MIVTKRMLVVVAAVLAACGSTSKPPSAPISNRESDTAASPSAGGTLVRMVTRSQWSGVLELTGDRDRAMAAAEKVMASHCGIHAYTITQEGEEAIGTDTSGGAPRTVTAWRVHYVCSAIDI